MDGRTKRVSLEFMGEGWADCFFEMRYLTWADAKEFIAKEEAAGDDWVGAIIEKLRYVFVSGQVLDGGKPVALTADSIADFDVEALKVLNNAALGYTDPKE